MLNEPKSFAIALTAAQLAAPVDSESTTLFDSTVAFGAKRLRHLPVKRLSFGAEHSHAGSLILQVSMNGGTNWDVYHVETMGVPAANNIGGPIDFLIDTFDDVKLIWTNGGTTQTTWRPFLFGHENRESGT